MSVNLRHTAALALVSWYLMVPPLKNGKPETAAPFSRWEIQSNYDTAAECQSDLKGLVKSALMQLHNPMSRDLQGQLLTADEKSLLLAVTKARCVASDNPRFKGK
jgi:hypothetical protein